MGTGNDNNTWGNNANISDFEILEDAIANVFSSAATSGTVDLSGTPPPAGPSQARFWQLLFTGSLTANLTVKVPNLTKEWLINNACPLNGFLVQMQTPSGTLVTIPQGWNRVWCDGVNHINVWPQGLIQNQMLTGSAAVPPYSFALETNSGWYRSGVGDLRCSIVGADILQILSTGINLVGTNSIFFNGTKFNQAAIVPSGSEMPFAGILAPTGWYFEDGTAYSRTTDATLFAAISVGLTGNTHGNTTIDGLVTDLRNLGLEGAFIEGTGISLGTTIVSINSASSLTVSTTIAGTNTGVSLRILPLGQGDGSTTFNIPDRSGIVLAARDNMNGTAAGRLTLAQTQGILGTKLGNGVVGGNIGGEQGHVQTPTEMANHGHGTTELAHTHNTTADDNASISGGVNGRNTRSVAPVHNSSPGRP